MNVIEWIRNDSLRLRFQNGFFFSLFFVVRSDKWRVMIVILRSLTKKAPIEPTKESSQLFVLLFSHD